MKKKDYELGIKLGKKPSFKDIIFKSLAKKVGHLPFFRGQDRLVRYFYPPNKFKNLNKGEIFNTEYFGVKYKGITSNYIDWGVYFKGGHEKGLIKFLKKEISNFDIYLDIGANSGTLSLPFIFEEKLDIICFEPLSYSFNKLKTNFEINNAPKRHKLINKAISNQTGIDWVVPTLYELAHFKEKIKQSPGPTYRVISAGGGVFSTHTAEYEVITTTPTIGTANDTPFRIIRNVNGLLDIDDSFGEGAYQMCFKGPAGASIN